MIQSKIPKVAHCFWYSPYGLPYLRFLSISSFAILNPDIELRLYTSKDLEIGNVFTSHEQSTVHATFCYFQKLSTFPNVRLIYIEKDFFDDIPVNISSAVHASDILRIILLYTEGGFWIDSDIVFTNSISNSFLSIPENNHVDTIFSLSSFGSICPYLTHRIGFLAGSRKNKFFEILYNQLKLKSDTNSYQAFGSELYNATFPTLHDITSKIECCNLLNIPNQALYSIHLTELFSNRFLFENFVNNIFILGCHWYGGGDQLQNFVKELEQSADYHKFINQSCIKKPSFILNLFKYAQDLITG